MSLAIIYSRARLGVNAPLVTVEVHLSAGLPGFALVGLPETSVKESRDRVRSALLNAGFEFPNRRITVNLAPADLPKEGGRFDLAIALGILAADGQIPATGLAGCEFLGELALTGELRGVLGVFPAALASRAAGRQLIIPAVNQGEGALLQAPILCASHIKPIALWLMGQGSLSQPMAEPGDGGMVRSVGDFQDVVGQLTAKRALEIAAAGRHHSLLIGPPGTGKSMLASRFIGLLPPLSDQAAQDTAAIYSSVGLPLHPATWHRPPYRNPHHGASAPALVGGGSHPTPGEISLAHNGVLFLDELPEFERRVLDALREPLESGTITISRALGQVEFPAHCQLIAAMNPSPCGHFGDNQARSTPDQTLRYLQRLSGPFLDRFDLSVDVLPLPVGSFSAQGVTGESTAVIAQRVAAAQARMRARQGVLNAELSGSAIGIHCALALADAQFLEQAIVRLELSARAWHRILKVARTIADLAAEPHIQREHLLEALSYRAMDRLLARLRH